MKEFITAVEEIEAEDEYGDKVRALIESGKSREEAETEADNQFGVISFKMDGRVMKAFPPNDGQLAFMLAALGRGQTDESRMGSVLNIMLSSLRQQDADYIENRLLAQGRNRLRIKTLEPIFEHLMEEWFARPTQPSSDSASSPPSDGQN